MRVGATAPGKLLVSGEYAVLEGAPAIVTSVGRRCQVTWTDRDGPSVAWGLDSDAPRFPEAAAARLAAEEKVGTVDGLLSVDVSALRSDRGKLGLGSSAASAAASAASVFLSRGHSLEDQDVVREVLDAALQGHASVAPSGSGVDVAASVLGGTLWYERDPMVARPVLWPVDMAAAVVWTGQPASTRELLAKVHSLRDKDPDNYRRCMSDLRAASIGFAESFFGGSTDLRENTTAVLASLDQLGRASGAPIVEAKLAKIAELALECGGAAKPSGAGGGDVALALFPSATGQLLRFEGACHQAGFELVEMPLSVPGVQALR